jgi:hypothetical protein
MKSMTLLVAMALVSPALTSHASGADLKPPRDGWASWEVPAVEGAPFYCCWNNWDDRKDARKPCKLDAHRSYCTRDDDGTTYAVTVDARFYTDLAEFFPASRFAKGTRFTVAFDNLFNRRQVVLNEAGFAPQQYQLIRRDPLGRTVMVELRKTF